MQGTTHLAAGIALAAIAFPTPLGIAGCAVGALLPDIDSPTSIIGRYIPILPKKLKHRTVTHTLWLAALTALLSVPMAAGVLSHLALDAFNPCGIRPLYPLKPRLRVPLLHRVMPSGGLADGFIGACLWAWVAWAFIRGCVSGGQGLSF